MPLGSGWHMGMFKEGSTREGCHPCSVALGPRASLPVLLSAWNSTVRESRVHGIFEGGVSNRGRERLLVGTVHQEVVKGA